MPSRVSLSFQRAQDAERQKLTRLGGLDRQAATGRVLSFQPTLTSAGAAPVVQPAALTGQYLRHNDLLIAWITMIIAGTFSAGTGAWLFSLPDALEVDQNADGNYGTWRSRIGTSETDGLVRSYSADRTKVYCTYRNAYPSGTQVQVGVGLPGTWAASSEMHLLVVGHLAT